MDVQKPLLKFLMSEPFHSPHLKVTPSKSPSLTASSRYGKHYPTSLHRHLQKVPVLPHAAHLQLPLQTIQRDTICQTRFHQSQIHHEEFLSLIDDLQTVNTINFIVCCHIIPLTPALQHARCRKMNSRSLLSIALRWH